MNHQAQVQIANAKTRFDDISQRQKEFLSHLQATSTPPTLPARLEFGQGFLIVEFLGHHLSAKPRTVRSSDGLFAVEYIFKASFEAESVEIWRFYLSAAGALFEDPEMSSRICDFNNSLAAQNILSHLLSRFASSPFFAPTEQLAG